MYYTMQTLTEYINAEVNMESFLPLLQILTSLRSHNDQTKHLFVTIGQQYTGGEE